MAFKALSGISKIILETSSIKKKKLKRCIGGKFLGAFQKDLDSSGISKIIEKASEILKKFLKGLGNL